MSDYEKELSAIIRNAQLESIKVFGESLLSICSNDEGYVTGRQIRRIMALSGIESYQDMGVLSKEELDDLKHNSDEQVEFNDSGLVPNPELTFEKKPPGLGQ